MSTSGSKTVDDLLAKAQIKVNGNHPWDMQIHSPRVGNRILRDWSLGLGESYMDGDWDCAALDEFFYRVLKEDIDEQVKGLARTRLVAEVIRAKLFNLQKKERAFQVGEMHYNVVMICLKKCSTL